MSKSMTQEAAIQATVVAHLKAAADRGVQVAYAADMNAGRRTPYEYGVARATGMMAGEPDLRVYLTGGRTIFIEFKGAETSVTRKQKERHELLRSLGFDVRLVRLKDLAEARAYALKLVEEIEAA